MRNNVSLENAFKGFFRDTYLIFSVGKKKLSNYGAQNETYMSRSAEKWVKGLCFNELGMGG